MFYSAYKINCWLYFVASTPFPVSFSSIEHCYVSGIIPVSYSRFTFSFSPLRRKQRKTMLLPAQFYNGEHKDLKNKINE